MNDRDRWLRWGGARQLVGNLVHNRQLTNRFRFELASPDMELTMHEAIALGPNHAR